MRGNQRWPSRNGAARARDRPQEKQSGGRKKRSKVEIVGGAEVRDQQPWWWHLETGLQSEETRRLDVVVVTSRPLLFRKKGYCELCRESGGLSKARQSGAEPAICTKTMP